MSNLQRLLTDRLAASESGSWNRLTVKLDAEHHEKLKRLAVAMALSKTSASEKILATAIDDAWAMYIDSLDEPEADAVSRELHQLLEAIYDEVRHDELNRPDRPVLQEVSA